MYARARHGWSVTEMSTTHRLGGSKGYARDSSEGRRSRRGVWAPENYGRRAPRALLVPVTES